MIEVSDRREFDMVYNTAAKRDFLIALAIFHSRYVSLFKLLSSYPPHLIDIPGAFGDLSVRQTVARLCNQLDAAHQCFGNFADGSHQIDACDADNMDVEIITTYETFSWPEVHGELRALTQDLLSRAVTADTQKRAGDPRYRKWLTRLSIDCAEIMRQLEDFANVDNRQQT